jgi:dihydrofolate reductase
MPFFDEEAMGTVLDEVMQQTEALLLLLDGGMQVMGNASLALQLVENDLVDEYRLMVEPILLGGGKTIFPSDRRARRLELVSATPAKTGALICAYRPAAA